MPSPLPYRDAKPVGAADFYFAINATFRFLEQKLGADGLRRYWTELGQDYFTPVTQLWQTRGLAGVAEYWRAFFAAEPGAEVDVIVAAPRESGDSGGFGSALSRDAAAAGAVTLEVKVCPAIRHLRAHHREIVPCFCQHCYFVTEAIAQPAGLTVRVEGGNGSCRQTFLRHEARPPPQDLSQIKVVR